MKIINTGIPVLTGCGNCGKPATLWEVYEDNDKRKGVLSSVAACSLDCAMRYFNLYAIVIKGVEFPPANYVEHLKSEVSNECKY